MMATDSLLEFWAKKSKDEPEIRYPLLYHMLDVAMVARKIWDESLHASVRHFLAEELGIAEPNARLWLSFWAGLHDIGKASPTFQCKSSIAQGKLMELGFRFQSYGPTDHHGILTACILKNLFHSMYSDDLGKRIAVTLGGHHGVFPRSLNLNDPPGFLNNKRWQEAWGELFRNLSDLCCASSLPPLNKVPGHAFFMMLAGLTSVADWIASNKTYFPYNNEPEKLDKRIKYSERQAAEALRELGWSGWKPAQETGEFENLFPFISQVRPLQNEVIEISKSLCGAPGLVIIEAPMGEGKTEAAMYLADSWATALGQKGCYFALPTQATSNQMFSRAKSFLDNRYSGEIVNLILLHGHSALSAEFDVLKQRANRLFEPHNIGEEEDTGYDGAQSSIVASEWFTYRKRGLLAPFGVGTIDQTLLAVLQTRHVFVRLFGLAGKTVIIDEVHAYDAYMSTLLERLVEWLAALGSSVVLLSATLPKRRRDSLLNAYRRGLETGDNSVAEAPYPRISWITASEAGARYTATSPQCSKTLNLQWVGGGLAEINTEFPLGKQLKQALACGGCAAVICNTVDRAQEAYLALKKYFPGTADDGQPECDLLHARYLYGERERREKRALVRFGKPGSEVDCGEEGVREVRRPNRAVLVATQVIEQSLDLDFDLMVSEMAPVDLILQRAGRLHRHERKDRPDHLRSPTILICQPGVKEDGVPDFGRGTEAVYDKHVLLRSWLVLKDRNSIRIPEEVEDIIEAVYGDASFTQELNESLRNKWLESYEKLSRKTNDYESKARIYCILPPTYGDDILEDFNHDLEEDNPETHESLQALTRLSEPTVSVICLYGEPTAPHLDSQHRQQVDMASCPDMPMTKILLMRSVSISHRGVVAKLVKEGQPVPKEWRKNPLLRHHYLLYFNTDNRCFVGTYELYLDEEQGLTIQRLINNGDSKGA